MTRKRLKDFLDQERLAFLITLMGALIFVFIGVKKGNNQVYGVSTSGTVTTTVNATINSQITIYATNTVNLAAIIPGTDNAARGWGYVAVTSNSANGYKIYNYMANYMSRTVDLLGSPVYIANTPVAGPTAPEAWVEDTDYGIGFSLSGPSNEAKWHNGAGYFNYSSFTTTSAAAQEVNDYTTWSSANPEYLSVMYVVDAGTAQASGTYRGFVYWFAITNV